MSQELLLVKACANYDPHTIKFFDGGTKEVGKLAMKDGVLTFTGNADEAAKVFVQHVCDRTFQLTSQIKELKQEKAELLAALKNIVDVGCEYYDMDMGENGSDALEKSYAAIEKAERREG